MDCLLVARQLLEEKKNILKTKDSESHSSVTTGGATLLLKVLVTAMAQPPVGLISGRLICFYQFLFLRYFWESFFIPKSILIVTGGLSQLFTLLQHS